MIATQARPGCSADVGFHAACQSDEFVIRQRKDGVGYAAGGPELVELGKRAIDDRGNGLWVTDRGNTPDRLAGVFTDKRR